MAKINVYCSDKGWLFEDLKLNIAKYGAVASKKPLDGYDAYICIRTQEAVLSPFPEKTVVQVHDMNDPIVGSYGMISFVHQMQKHLWEDKGFSGKNFVLPIGSRDIPFRSKPDKPTIGFFCREGNNLEKGSDIFKSEILKALSEVDFEVLMIGERLKSLKPLGHIENRAAEPLDYQRITALVTASKSVMVPLSAYEALACGRKVITTTRFFPSAFIGCRGILMKRHDQLHKAIIKTVKENELTDPIMPFKRDDWCKAQIKLAESLLS